jgi:hypothetical protein
VLAPDGIIVKVLPAQIEPLLTLMLGLALTVILQIAGDCETQTEVPVPITVYELVIVGFTRKLPPCTVYELAPDGIMEKDCPAQMEPLFTPILGLALRVTLLMAGDCDSHPAVLVPATVYEFEMVGFTIKLPPCTV